MESGSFTYCGKKIEQLKDGTIRVSMVEYHSDLKPVVIPLQRRQQPQADLTPQERKQLRAILGSMQWLVAQVRVDMAFHLSVLQAEPPKISTLLKANALLKRFKLNPEFSLMFRPMCLDDAGILVVTDSSLGNVQPDGSCGDDAMKRTHAQSAYVVLLAEKTLMEGNTGKFCVLDGRSHRIQRVCRSTYGAEHLGAEEALDVGEFARGLWAMVCGQNVANVELTRCSRQLP